MPWRRGVTVGSAKTWLYDVGLALGGLAGPSAGIAPFVQGGIGGITNDTKVSVLETRSSNVTYTVGVGADIGLSGVLALRVQAKDSIRRFTSDNAVGFRANGNRAHNVALTAGVTLRFQQSDVQMP